MSTGEPVVLDLGNVMGPSGSPGTKGDNGLKATMAVGTVTAIGAGQTPTVSIESEDAATNTYTLAFGLPGFETVSNEQVVADLQAKLGA